jgi:DNA-binding HxlR family transcriptional regulator
MPDFIYDNKIYYNPVELALRFIGGTYKMPILWRLNQQMMRYGELKKTLPHISHKTLSVQLRQLEADGLIERKVFAVVPPRVEYTITKEGRKAIPVIETIREFGKVIMKDKGIKEGSPIKAKKITK